MPGRRRFARAAAWTEIASQARIDIVFQNPWKRMSSRRFSQEGPAFSFITSQR
ncbi:hypothetical protein [Streptomyces sp. NPDC048272]|uniref:hypothetical protein n=1 Tax=Streptomyces sp. NPDC048272 TaxID=3154616 RepID=UPI003448762E